MALDSELALGDVDPATGSRVSAIVAGRLANGSIKERAQDLNERQFLAQRQEHADSLQQHAAEQSLRQHEAALREAMGYYDLAAKLTEVEERTKSHLDAADFLTTIKDLRHDDPEFEAKSAAIAARFPRAGADPMVQQVLSTKTQAHRVMQEATKEGGAYEFPEGPAQQTYKDVLRETLSPVAARAAARNVHEGEKMISDARANGLIIDSDLDWHDDPAQRSLMFKPDGTINYDYARAIVDKRKSDVAGSTYKAGMAEKRQELEEKKYHRDIVANYIRGGFTAQSDPVATEIYQQSAAYLLGKGGKSAASPTPAPTPSAGPTPPTKINSTEEMQKALAEGRLKPGDRFLDSNGKPWTIPPKPAK